MQSAALLWPFTAQLRSRRRRRQIVRLRSAGWCRRLSGASGGVGQARCAGGARRIVAQIAISKNLKPKETLTYTHVHIHTNIRILCAKLSAKPIENMKIATTATIQIIY